MIMKTLKTLVITAIASVGIALGAAAQGYYSTPLVATNLFVLGTASGSAVATGTTTNLVAANYAYNTSGSAFENLAGAGVFELKPGAHDQYFSAQGGPSFMFIYLQSTNAAGQNSQVGQPVDVVANIALIPDDWSLKYGYATPTTVLVTNTMVTTSSNAICTGITQPAASLFKGARYGKLLGITTYSTNGVGVLFRGLRVGYWDSKTIQ